MSFGGHVNDMMNRVKQNAALKDARHRKFKGGNDYSNTESTKTEYNFSKMSKLEFNQFKQKIRIEAKKEQQKRILFWIFFIILPTIIALSIFLLY